MLIAPFNFKRPKPTSTELAALRAADPTNDLNYWIAKRERERESRCTFPGKREEGYYCPIHGNH